MAAHKSVDASASALQEAENCNGPAVGDVKVLEWAYANITTTASIELLEKRTGLMGGHTVEESMLERLEEIAECQGNFWDALNRRRQLECLR